MIYAEAKLGELLRPLGNPTLSREGKRQLPDNVTYKVSHQAQTIAANPEKVQDDRFRVRPRSERVEGVESTFGVGLLLDHSRSPWLATLPTSWPSLR